jgi:hypothetical protein
MSAIHVFFASAIAYSLTALPAAARELRLEEFFVGRSVATGSFKTITGYKREFDVKLHGSWDGRTLTLREDFTYDDGERDTKTWRFRRTGPSTYEGTREDVIGPVTVRLVNNKAYFNYRVDIDPKGSGNIVRFFDKLVLSDDGKTMANTARVFKGPLPVAFVRVDFKR